MSMLSAQCDELRALAGDGSTEFVAGPIRASVLREAADTILGLRDRAQDLQAENAKLRELVVRVERARRDLCDAYIDAVLLNCEECPAWNACGADLADRMRELGVEVE